MIVVEGLSKAYGGVHACDELSLSIESGTVTAVVGPNGAGKSTFVQLLSGVIAPDAGAIRIGGRDITRLSSTHRFALGMARSFQTARVFPGLSVFDSVFVGAYNGLLYKERAFGLRTTVGDTVSSLLRLPAWRERERHAGQIVLQVLELFGDRLLPRRDEFTFTLSYANRRRVELARTLASRPSVLVLDEPTAGMNPTETDELAGILEDTRREHPELTIVFVEHKMDVVRRISDRVIVMDAGRMIADDTPDEALGDPRVIEAYLGTGAGGAAQA